MEKSRAIITAVSNKFFPSVLNLINSIRANYDTEIEIHVYDLGLSRIFRNELERIEFVHVIDMPHFCEHWRSCYTWKTYIFTKPFATYNLYLDAGCQIDGTLDAAFEKIVANGYFVIEQGPLLADIVPEEYTQICSIDEKYYSEAYIDAGVFGFDKSVTMRNLTGSVYNAARAGLCLGFSPQDTWRNRGKNKSIFVRDCKQFRHDMTVLNIFLRKHIGDLEVSDSLNILKIRMNYRRLRYVNKKMKYRQNTFAVSYINRCLVNGFILMRGWLLTIRRKHAVYYMDLKHKKNINTHI